MFVIVSMKFVILFFCLVVLMSGVLTSGSNNINKKRSLEKVLQPKNIEISDSLCKGIYKGAEFDSKQGDIAHQYSNVMSKIVGDQLKKLYSEGKYSKVDFQHILMTTKGMNDGDNYVVYELVIPFVRVKDKCDARTAFDHCGGWGHAPDIEKRKAGFVERGPKVMAGNELDISDLKTTKEGLQEFWLQWKHIDYQSECK